jgi:hypothetical protein
MHVQAMILTLRRTERVREETKLYQCLSHPQECRIALKRHDQSQAPVASPLATIVARSGSQCVSVRWWSQNQ